MAGTVRRMGSIKVWEVLLTVATGATTATATTDRMFSGYVRKIEIDPGTLKATATIKGYEATTDLATGTRDHFLSYTVPNPAVELVIYPLFESSSLNTGGALTTKSSQAYCVCDYLKIDLAGANAADTVTLRVYVEGE